MSNSLLITVGEERGKKFLLSNTAVNIGRDATNEICISDIEASRRHCQINSEDGGFVLCDLESSNGTYLNGIRIQKCRLRHKDRIKVGGTILVFDQQSAVKTLISVDDSRAGISRSFPASASDKLTASFSRLEDESTYYDVEIGQEEASRRFIQVGNDLRFLYQASLATRLNSDSSRMLEEILDLILEWIAADRGCIFLNNQSGYELSVFRDLTKQTPESEIQFGKEIINYVNSEKVGVLSSHASTDERWRLSSVRTSGINEVICVPIQGRSEILGIIYIDTIVQLHSPKSTRFNEDHLKILVAMAHQTAVAIENEAYYRAIVEKDRLEAIGQITGVIAHHVKNTIQGINGGSHLIESGLKTKDLQTIEKGWQIVNRNQEQISRLVIDMLIAGRAYQPNLEFEDLNLAIGEAVKSLSYQLEESRVRVDFVPNQDLPKIKFDFSGITNCFWHILSCCLSSCQTSDGGSINIRLEESGNYVAATIACGGHPIEITDSNDALEQLKQFQNERHGIGILVTRKILTAHAGKLALEYSPPKNQFSLMLPLDSN